MYYEIGEKCYETVYSPYSGFIPKIGRKFNVKPLKYLYLLTLFIFFILFSLTANHVLMNSGLPTNSKPPLDTPNDANRDPNRNKTLKISFSILLER